MQTLIKVVIVIFLFSLCIFGQQLSRSQKIGELRKLKIKIEQNPTDRMKKQYEKYFWELTYISEEDNEEAKRIGAKAIRLFPDGILDVPVDFPEGENWTSVYTFDEIAGEYYSPSIEYKNGSLEIVDVFAQNNFGFIASIGGTLLETINEKSPEFIALAKYEPPTEIKNIKGEYESDGLTFRNKASVTAGNTYLLRAIRYSGGDGIFAIKVYRKDSDGSIVIFV